MDYRDWLRMNPSGYDHHDPDAFVEEEDCDEEV